MPHKNRTCIVPPPRDNDLNPMGGLHKELGDILGRMKMSRVQWIDLKVGCEVAPDYPFQVLYLIGACVYQKTALPLVQTLLNPSAPYGEQDLEKVAIVISETTKALPFLKIYKDGWPIRVYLARYFYVRMYRGRKTWPSVSVEHRESAPPQNNAVSQVSPSTKQIGQRIREGRKSGDKHERKKQDPIGPNFSLFFSSND
ncbi:hypothetical protein CONPUDRAFT_76468 [Coniophora puteana RWD-64-598 SS2]|uniref:Uncharacterized protein n=1 Tax=Coniophora puteana (strain RWD-64-598) TaxID=741705 RepID=A0A5M3MDK4_CONPW|nr:uncharacterized protein CONPUDRAFT_76468 [Coniophora puteana RWD-64-598 SS2]EIW76924.1 hypothetical protein CONPUDRAFT_76468 [Coniophora puteana RWD-64-598 SS2]